LTLTHFLSSHTHSLSLQHLDRLVDLYAILYENGDIEAATESLSQNLRQHIKVCEGSDWCCVSPLLQCWCFHPSCWQPAQQACCKLSCAYDTTQSIPLSRMNTGKGQLPHIPTCIVPSASWPVATALLTPSYTFYTTLTVYILLPF